MQLRLVQARSIGFQSPAPVPTTVALSFVPNSLRYFRCEKTGAVRVTNRGEKRNIDPEIISMKAVLKEENRKEKKNCVT